MLQRLALPALCSLACVTACVAAYRRELSLPAVLAPLPSFATAMLSARKPVARAYAALGAAAWLAAGALLAAPHIALSLLHASATQSGLATARLLGASLISVAVAHWVLSDAADRGRLGASTFKSLNAHLAAASLAVAAACVAAHASVAYSGLLAVAGAQAVPAALCLWQYWTAKK